MKWGWCYHSDHFSNTIYFNDIWRFFLYNSTNKIAEHFTKQSVRFKTLLVTRYFRNEIKMNKYEMKVMKPNLKILLHLTDFTTTQIFGIAYDAIIFLHAGCNMWLKTISYPGSFSFPLCYLIFRRGGLFGVKTKEKKLK